MQQISTDFLDHAIYPVQPENESLARATQDFDNRTALETTIIHDIGPNENASDTWERNYFLVNGVPIYYYVARAENELGVIVGCSGLKSDFPLKKNAVEAYNKAGISVIMMTLPNPGRTVGFMHFFEKVFKKFALDDDSPVNKLFPAELPKFLYGHSTGGQLVTRMITAAEDAAEISKKFVRALIEAPFFDNANASRHDSVYRDVLFNKYACLHKHDLPRETFLGLSYLHYNAPEFKAKLTARLPDDASRIKRISLTGLYVLQTAVRSIRDLHLNLDLPTSHDIPEPFFALREVFKTATRKTITAFLNDQDIPTPWYQRESEYKIPTYGQILEDQNKGRKFIDEGKNKGLKAAIPCTVVASPNDSFSCTVTIEKDVVPLLEADFYQAEGEHDPLSQDDNALNYSIEQMKPHLLDEPLPDAKTEPGRWSIKLLSHRFSSSLKHSASFLNPFARLFK